MLKSERNQQRRKVHRDEAMPRYRKGTILEKLFLRLLDVGKEEGKSDIEVRDVIIVPAGSG